MTTSTGRSSESRRSSRSVGQWLLGLLIVLALAASVLMVFSRNLSIEGTLAVIAALWAAVIGAILVTRFRKQAESAEAKSRDLRLVYELQLEREIAARRQYELDVETTVRKEVAAESGAELASLKEQVVSLRASLERLLGEPLPDDQVALPNEKLRELASGLGGARPSTDYAAATMPAYGQDSGYGEPGIHDDGIVAARDFAQTVPSTDDGRHLDSTIDPNEMTEVIPIVTDDPLSGRIAVEVEAPADASVDVTYESVTYEATPAAEPAAEVASEFVDDSPTDEWVPQATQGAAPVPFWARGRHESPGEVSEGGRRRRRDDVPAEQAAQPAETTPVSEPEPAPVPEPEPAENAADDSDNAHSNGLPVSELLRQLREADAAAPGGRRRRRD